MISSLLSLNLDVLFNFLAFEKKKSIKEAQQKSTKTSEKLTKTLGIASKEKPRKSESSMVDGKTTQGLSV